MEISTTAIIFPAISLLLLAYTNRFMVISQRIRSLHDKYRQDTAGFILEQIANLRQRIILIRWMQGMGVIAFILCCFCILMILMTLPYVIFVFASSICCLIGSLFLALYEIAISTRAIELELKGIEHGLR